MRISEPVKHALREAAAKHGSQVRLGKATGVLPENINRYISGKIRRIEHENWSRLEPFLRPWLPDGFNPFTGPRRRARAIEAAVIEKLGLLSEEELCDVMKYVCKLTESREPADGEDAGRESPRQVPAVPLIAPGEGSRDSAPAG
jgi:hypothetical protein